jgi:TonB family protein
MRTEFRYGKSLRAFCERRRFALFFSVLTLLHLGVLFLWPGSGRDKNLIQEAAAPQIIRLTEIDIAVAPEMFAHGVAPLALRQEDEISDASALPVPAGTSAAGFLPLSEADTLPVSLIDIRSLMNYPEQARRMHKQGIVVAELHITADGRVYDARLVQRAGWGFDEEVLRKIRRVRFRPAYRDGKPIPVTVQIPVEFVLK